jgi:hypothetical protein
MKIQGFKRIIIEDFDEKDRGLVSKLAFAINVFAEDITAALNKNLTIEDNLNIIKKDITVTVNNQGVPITPVIISTGLRKACAGIQVIKAINQTSPTTYPTSCPFISFTDNGGLVTVSKITGLQADNKYSLRLILYP